MAWPFGTPVAPTNFAAPGTTVPSVATEIGGGVERWIIGMHFINLGSVDGVVTVTNSAGDIIFQETIPALPGGGGTPPYSPAFEPTVGIKWSVSNGADVKGHIWGY